MLAKNSPVFSRQGWVYELKYDGWRALADRKQILTRNRLDITARFPPIATVLSELPEGFVLDGEVCLLDKRGVPDFEALQTSRRRGYTLAFFAFDLLFDKGADLRGLPLLERKARLRKLIPKNHLHLRYVDHLETHGELLYAYALSIGMEGVVAKKADSKYIAGTNSYWLKFKPSGAQTGFKRPLRQRSAKDLVSKRKAASK